jgi:2-hydroxychromene-2-carboxylate isomerase
MSMRVVEFYFDFRSPYSYLAHSQLGSLGAAVNYHPMDVVAVMQQAGNTPTTVSCEAKGRYADVDLQRWSKRYGIPLCPRKDISSVDGRKLLRAVLAANECGLATETVTAIFFAFWRHGSPLSTTADIVRVLYGAGIFESGILSGLDDGELSDRLLLVSKKAADRGVFGVPTFIVNGEMFFGNDRIEFVREHLEAA